MTFVLTKFSFLEKVFLLTYSSTGTFTFKEFGFILQGYYVDPGSSDEPK